MDREYNIILEGRESKCLSVITKIILQEISLIPKKRFRKNNKDKIIPNKEIKNNIIIVFGKKLTIKLNYPI